MLQDFIQCRVDISTDQLMIEMLLLYIHDYEKARKLSHLLLDRFISISGIFNASIPSLCEVEGVKLDTAVFIKVIYSTVRCYYSSLHTQNPMITDSDTAKVYMSGKLIGLSNETVYLAGMGNNSRVLFCKKMVEGTPLTVNIAPLEILRAALREDAVKIVLAHNHPHGSCNPSSEDIFATRMLLQELGRFDIELFDHIIVGADGICSMRERNMLNRYSRYASTF